MKKFLSSIFLLLLTSSTLFACDICGGGAGSYYIGLLPQFNRKLVGIRYQQNQLYTDLDINGNKTALSNIERYQTLDIWGAWNLGSKWRIMAILPYSFIEKNNIGTDQLNKRNGISDITISGYYNLLQHTNNIANQTLWFGLGIKLPTGDYNNLEVVGNSPNIFQLGTGSIDFLTQLNYDINIADWGLNSTINYKINTNNQDDYRYGNKLTANLAIYRNLKIGSDLTISPNIGLLFEHQEHDNTMGFSVDQTGGNILQGSYGIEAAYSNIAIGANFQSPIQQNLASHRIELKNKLMVCVIYFLISVYLFQR